MKALLAAAAATALLTTGCAQSLPNAAAADTSGAAIADIQTSVNDAIVTAKEYGQDHLGHFLKLNPKSLRAQGFAPTGGVALTVYVDHYDICVNGKSATLPADNEWSTATATSDTPEPVAGGRCSSDALRTFTIRG